MAAEQRKLLEQLMGDQLMSAGTRPAQLNLMDAKVCRSYVVGACPHDLFTNTKGDIGSCPQVHVPNLREEYHNMSEAEKQKLGFEFDYQRYISKWISECDRRIDQAHRRLEKTPDELRQTNVLLGQIADLQKSIEAGLVEVEILAEEGAVNMAVQDFHKVRQSKLAKEDRERDLRALADNSGPSGHQKLQVCDVCGAYLSRLDNDRRLADHFFGKMHLGYASMRKESERLKVVLKDRVPPPRPNDDAEDPYAAGNRGYGGSRGGYNNSYGGGYGGGNYGGRGGGYGGRRGRY